MCSDYGFCLNVSVIKYFWNKRNRSIFPKPSGIVKQKYLLFYNLFSMINDKPYTFENVVAFKNGPIYSDVYHETKNNVFLESLDCNNIEIDKKIADLTLQLMYLYKEMVSTVTHNFEFWQKAFNRADKHIHEDDITDNDRFGLKVLYNEIVEVNKNYNIFFNDNGVPLLLKKEQSSVLKKDYKQELNSYNNTNKCPTYVVLDNGEVYFD